MLAEGPDDGRAAGDGTASALRAAQRASRALELELKQVRSHTADARSEVRIAEAEEASVQARYDRAQAHLLELAFAPEEGVVKAAIARAAAMLHADLATAVERAVREYRR